ncbi:MAG: hypothetical protein LQ338_007383 [Usnochroma carphineum]|nr:MAG: hypothetical protein LQ338_007383 [Usnochroma carphineum]
MITGAGISTNCGIPDFRSEDGLYALIQSQYTKAFTTVAEEHETSNPSCGRQKASALPQRQTRRLPTNVKGKDLFDSRMWKDPTSTSVFYTFIASLRKQIREEVRKTTPTHRFIRTIRDSRKLVRCYTQNIDGLESRLGLCMDLDRGRGSRSRFTVKAKNIPRMPVRNMTGSNMDGGCEVVPLHGDLAVLRCTLCQKTCGWDEGGREAMLQRGKAPECFSCAVSDQQRRDRGKRGTKIGTLRPNIVLYGEEHPAADALGSITTNDLSLAPDVLLILGTSLHVQGVKTLVKEFARCVHARPKAKGKVIFVNLSKPSESTWQDSIDYWVSMDCDAWIGTLRQHRPDIWPIQTELRTRVIKKDVSRPTKSSAVPSPEAVSPDHKENAVCPSTQGHGTPQKRSPGRPRKKPLAEISSNEVSLTEVQTCEAGSHMDFVRHNDPLQLATPPPSKHKHGSQESPRKRTQPLNKLEVPATPSKRARLSAQLEDELFPLKRPWPSEAREVQYSPAKRRKTGIEIWED